MTELCWRPVCTHTHVGPGGENGRNGAALSVGGLIIGDAVGVILARLRAGDVLVVQGPEVKVVQRDVRVVGSKEG